MTFSPPAEKERESVDMKFKAVLFNMQNFRVASKKKRLREDVMELDDGNP